MFHLSAVMYVKDTALLYWPPSSGTEPEELVAHVQHATIDYSSLAQASGGILKEKKCLVYFLDYKFICGCAQMNLLEYLPAPRVYITDKGWTHPSHTCIPQPVSPDASIKTHDVATASKCWGCTSLQPVIPLQMSIIWYKKRLIGLTVFASSPFLAATHG
jgi:hypothetical protein